MEKVYVRFGDIRKNDANISVFEAIAEGNVIKILMPTMIYPTCQAIARNLDVPAFLVVGDIVGVGHEGEPLMSNCKIKIPLRFDSKIENYICDEPIPRKRLKIRNPNIPVWYQKY